MFDRKKIIIKYGIIILLSLTLIVAVFIRQKQMSNVYHLTYEISDMDSTMTYDGYEINVTGVDIWESINAYIGSKGEDYAQYDEKYENVEDGIIEIRVNIKKTGESEKEDHNLSDFGLLYGASKFGFDVYMAKDLNNGNIFWDMAVGEEREYIIPFSIYSDNYNKKQWKNRDKLEYQLVTEVYPVKRAINIDNLEWKTGPGLDYSDIDIADNKDNNIIDNIDNGEGEISESQTIEVGGCKISIYDQKFIHNISEINSLPETGIRYMVSEYDYCFNPDTGEVMEDSNQCFIQYTVDITNVGTTDKTYYIGNNRINDGEEYSYTVSGELIYSSIYNENADIHGMLTFDIAPGETITCIIVEAMFGYYHYDYPVLYYAVNQLGGPVYIGGGTASFIALNMDGSEDNDMTNYVNDSKIEDERLNGNGQVYDMDETISLGDLTYKVLSVDFITNISQIEDIAGDRMSLMDLELWDGTGDEMYDINTGEKILGSDKHMDSTEIKYVIEVTNTGSETLSYNIMTSKVWDDEAQGFTARTGALFQTDTYNKKAAAFTDESYIVDISPGETLKITKVEMILGNLYDYKKIYIAINPMGYDDTIYIGGGTAAFIEWDMEE